jgi:hypothetical protein
VAELLTTIEGSLASGASTARRAEARRQAGRPDPTQGTVVTLRVTDSAAAVETLRAAGLLLELIEESTP